MTKAKPRKGEFGFADDAPPFDLTDEQTIHLWDLISLTDRKRQDILRAKLDAASREHLERREEEKTWPRVAEQNAAIEEILVSAQKLEVQLREVDHLSQDELFRSLEASPLVDDNQSAPEGGFDQYQNLRFRLEHFTRTLAPHLEHMKARVGRTKDQLPRIFVTEVAEAYEEVTSNLLTHSANVAGTYKGKVKSTAGRFVLALVKMADTSITEQRVCSVLAEYVKHRK